MTISKMKKTTLLKIIMLIVLIGMTLLFGLSNKSFWKIVIISVLIVIMALGRLAILSMEERNILEELEELDKGKDYKGEGANETMGNISLARLRKQVEKQEALNKKVDKLLKDRAEAENERTFLNKKLKTLKRSRTPIGKLRSKIPGLVKRSKPLALRLKRALDNASRNA